MTMVMTMNDYLKLREYIHSLPGAVFGTSPEDVLSKIWADAGCSCSLDDLKLLLFSCGYSVQQFDSGKCCIGFPEGPYRGPGS